jgi:hypothetical protein
MFQNCNAVERNTKAEKYRGKRQKRDSREAMKIGPVERQTKNKNGTVERQTKKRDSKEAIEKA